MLRCPKAGDLCEREIDATDPLRPSTNELSGAKLLLRRAIKEVVIRKLRRQGHNSEPRLGTATSQHTFVIEPERRKPLVLPVGLTDGAIEYKRSQEELRKAREEEEKQLQRERAESEEAKAKERERKEVTNHTEGGEFNKANRTPTQKKTNSASSNVISCVNSTPTPTVDNSVSYPIEFEDER
ncbi:unnamed protein product [Angiostrongylus costaricensis]|uniref:Uncharacterized protein n=1 Tax=Angiostrongylus costaricensis TaxID=334426 RepID=A0A158PDX4_ANGCS|nr:unnamed protein product [Angiostrongylus costaricensis]